MPFNYHQDWNRRTKEIPYNVYIHTCSEHTHTLSVHIPTLCTYNRLTRKSLFFCAKVVPTRFISMFHHQTEVFKNIVWEKLLDDWNLLNAENIFMFSGHLNWIQPFKTSIQSNKAQHIHGVFCASLLYNQTTMWKLFKCSTFHELNNISNESTAIDVSFDLHK